MKGELRKTFLKFPSYPEAFGLELTKPEDRFKWFLASMLFAKRISSKIAGKTFMKLIEAGLTTPEKILEAGWGKLVEILDSGGYVRYDYSTATNILEAAKLLINRYDGSLEKLYEEADSFKELENRLREFKGVGPTAISIFLRELKEVWVKAKPKPSSMAIEVGKRLKLKKNEIENFEGKLVRLNLEFCKKRKCMECFFKNFCR
jgi:endonuclease III